MTDIFSQWSKTTRPDGDPSPYRSSSLALAKGSQAELKVKLDVSEENLNAGDFWNFVRLPADAVIDALFLTASDLDDGSALNVMLEADDGTTDSDLLSAKSDVAQAGGTVFANNNLPYIGGDEEVTVRAHVIDAADTAKAGEATLTVRFSRA
jgi:hypothetical protein